VAFLEEMGVVEGRTSDGEPIVAEQHLCHDPEERVFYRGRWYEGLYLYAGASAADFAQLHAFDTEINRWVAWHGARGRRAFSFPLTTSSDDTEVTSLDTITMSEWLDRHGWHSPRLHWFINYACRDDYGLTIELLFRVTDSQSRRCSSAFPLAWDNVIYDSPALGYVTTTHQRGISHGPTILTYYYPLCEEDGRTARNKLLAMDWQSCADVVLTDLRRPHPDIRSLVDRLDIMRWGHAMIQPRPGFVWSTAWRQASVPFRNIHFAHTDLSGVALFEEAFAHGMRAAREVLAGRRGPRNAV
jgi:hypothetical protein